MSNKNDSYIGVLLEQIRDEIRSLHEAVADVLTRGKFNELWYDVAEIKKAAVAVVSQDMHHGALAGSKSLGTVSI